MCVWEYFVEKYLLEIRNIIHKFVDIIKEEKRLNFPNYIIAFYTCSVQKFMDNLM